MIVPTENDVNASAIGELVADRLEATSLLTDSDNIPEPGERKGLGTVHWDDNGIPVRLEFDTGETLFFDRDGVQSQTEDFQLEELKELAQDVDDQIEAAKQQIRRCQDTKQALSEIDQTISHFDSVACGSIEVDEDANTLAAIISTHEIGERIEEFHRKFRWDSFEVDHLQDLRLFQVRMEIPLKRVKAGSGMPAGQA
ncbi:hypothetical protein D3D01_16105 [Haloarcula sp. Atlit-7R]|nr:hypothetical protein D3D01_16105 [Haloarcula sp. Atlit-7R]